MTAANQITPGMTIEWRKEVYRVEVAVKVSPPKGAPFIKTKLHHLRSGKLLEKSFKLTQTVSELSLEEHQLEYLYPEGKEYLFLDVDTLEQVVVLPLVLGDKVNYLKEGVAIKALLYGQTIFSVELPQFLELMVVKTEAVKDGEEQGNGEKAALLETGAKVEVPLFIEVGDVIKVDVHAQEYIQRV